MHHAPPLIRPPKPKQKPTLRKIGPYTYEVWNYDGPVFNAVRDLYAVGGTQSKYRPGPMDTISLQESRARSRDHWARSTEPNITLWMDQSQVIPRTRINRRAPGVYDAVRAIFRDQHRIPQGAYSMRSLANGPLKGKLDVVGYANQELLHKNDTAERGKVYWSIPLMQNPSLGGVVGSYRTYLDDNTTVTQGRQGTHIMAYENLADDNWDYTSDNELAQVYSFLAKEPGKTVQLKYKGPAVRREFYISNGGHRIYEVPQAQPLPRQVRQTIEDARWRAYKHKRGGAYRGQIK